MNIVKLPTASTPDKREQRRQRARESARKRRQRQAERQHNSPGSRVFRMVTHCWIFDFECDNDNKALCRGCQQHTEARERGRYGVPFCMVCGEPR